METKKNIKITNTESFATSIRLTANFKINGINFFASGDYSGGNLGLDGTLFLDFVEVFREEDSQYFDEETEEFQIGEDILSQIDIIKTLTLL
jgi:hypothetical protein